MLCLFRCHHPAHCAGSSGRPKTLGWSVRECNKAVAAFVCATVAVGWGVHLLRAWGRAAGRAAQPISAWGTQAHVGG